jgi:hypothetical protein
MATLPNKLIDPVAPSNTRELREQVQRATRLEQSVAHGVGYQLINTTIVDGRVPEPTIMNVSRDGGALALPFDEVTDPRINVQDWGPNGVPGAAVVSNGEAPATDVQSFYNLKS